MVTPFLAKLGSAGALPDEDHKLLLDLVDDVRDLPAGTDIISEGDRPDHVHLMLEGWAARYQHLQEGSSQITAFMLPGDFCDTHITLLAEMDHSISALTDARVAFIPRAAMVALTERPAIARALWWASLVDEGILRAWIVNIARRLALPRIAHLVCELHARLAHVGLANGDGFALPLTQEQLGTAVGLTSVHVNRTLRTLRDDGLMTFRNREIVITNIPALRALAGFDPNYLHLRPRGASAHLRITGAQRLSTMPGQ